MTVRASARASEPVPPRRFSMARASVFTVIMSLHPAPGVIWAPVAFIGLPDCGRKARPPSPPFFGSDSRGPTFILSRLNIAEHLLSRLARIGHVIGSHETEVRDSDC